MTIRLKHVYDSVINVMDTTSAKQVITVLDHVNHYATKSMEICARKESLNRIEYLKVVGHCDTMDIEEDHIDLSVHNSIPHTMINKYDAVWGVGNPMGCLTDQGVLCNYSHMPAFFDNMRNLLKKDGILVLEIVDTLDWSPWYEFDNPTGVAVRTTEHKPKDFPAGLVADLVARGARPDIKLIRQTATGVEFADSYLVHPEYTLVYKDGKEEKVVSEYPVEARRYGVSQILNLAEGSFHHSALIQATGRKAITCFKDGKWINSAAPTHLVCSQTRLKGGAAPMKMRKT